MHGQAVEVYCDSLVNEDSYEAPYLNIDRERERERERPWMSCYIGCLPLPPLAVLLVFACPMQKAPSECRVQAMRHSGRQTVGQSATIRERSLTMFVVQVWGKRKGARLSIRLRIFCFDIFAVRRLVI